MFEAATGFCNLPVNIFSHQGESVTPVASVLVNLELEPVEAVLTDAFNTELDCAQLSFEPQEPSRQVLFQFIRTLRRAEELQLLIAEQRVEAFNIARLIGA